MEFAATRTYPAAPRRPIGMSATGMVFSIGIHAALLGAIATRTHRIVSERREEARARSAAAEDTPHAPFSFVPARLLKLGNEAPETHLPQREVPALPTAPPEPEVIPRVRPDPDSRIAGPRPVRGGPMDIDPRRIPVRSRRAVPSDEVNLVWDRLRQDFPERGGWSRVRGFPDGHPDGTELDRSLARPGDWYATDLMRFFQDRWTIPNMIGQRELARLTCKVRIALDAGFRIVDFEMIRPSGNPRYDASVTEVLRKLQMERTALPPVPSQVRDYIVANGMILTWRP
ncbi:MAG: TonB C-terminal domain-containing protein [Myxococcota bacterium]|nr:TonB C-terminal domain-containing protein [Myxococcota bacterium]